MRWILYVLLPVLVHLVLTEGTAVLTGTLLDSAACTALSAFFTLLAVGWMVLKSKQKLQILPGEPKNYMAVNWQLLLWIPVCFLGGGLSNIFYSGLLNWLRITSYFSDQTQEALLGSRMIAQIFGPGFLVPIAEELVYRGLLYTRMKERLSAGSAAFFSALLFALLHGNPIQMIYAFPMALLLALIYEKSGCLICPVQFHMGANLAAILL